MSIYSKTVDETFIYGMSYDKGFIDLYTPIYDSLIKEKPMTVSKALGIHDHPSKKLGLIPNDPRKDRLKFARFLKAVPEHPITDLPPSLTYPMDDNDNWGDCVVAGSDHALQTIMTALTGSYTNWDDAKILELYKTQNPRFDPTSIQNGPGSDADGGMDIQTFLGELLKRGYIVGFAEIDLTNEEEIKAAIYLGLAIITGETLEVAQQTQTVWDYANSALWGGHCTVWNGYSIDKFPCVTWGEIVNQTWKFVQKQVTEAWFILTQAHVDHPDFRKGFGLSTFSDAFTTITGKAFPVVAPTPEPPTPNSTPLEALFEATEAWTKLGHSGVNKKAAHALETYFKAVGLE